MALPRLKTEMRGDTSRWGHRAAIKRAANRLRREADKMAARHMQKRTIMRNSILVILVLLLNACGGEAFTAEFDAVGGDAGGDAGEPAVTAAGGSATAGTSSTGGMAAGSHAGGSASGGSGGSSVGGATTAGAPAGGSAAAGMASGGSAGNTCALDTAALTAALPSTITWQSFDLAQTDVCAVCGYEPCGDFKVTWSDPVVKDNVVTLKASYANNRGAPTTVRIANNTVGCDKSSYGMCDFKLIPAPISVTVVRQDGGWVVTKASVTVDFDGGACAAAFGKPGELLGQMNIDLQSEILPLLINLKIPCN